jgi:hypothetical protein
VDDAKKAELRHLTERRIREGWLMTPVVALDLLSLLSASDEAARLREENERLREALRALHDVADTLPHQAGLEGPLAFAINQAHEALSRSETKGGEEKADG